MGSMAHLTASLKRSALGIANRTEAYSLASHSRQAYGFPVAIYRTTYYSHYNRPIFSVIYSYRLRRTRHSRLWLKLLTGKSLIADPVDISQLSTVAFQGRVCGLANLSARGSAATRDGARDAFKDSLKVEGVAA